MNFSFATWGIYNITCGLSCLLYGLYGDGGQTLLASCIRGLDFLKMVQLGMLECNGYLHFTKFCLQGLGCYCIFKMGYSSLLLGVLNLNVLSEGGGGTDVNFVSLNASGLNIPYKRGLILHFW